MNQNNLMKIYSYVIYFCIIVSQVSILSSITKQGNERLIGLGVISSLFTLYLLIENIYLIHKLSDAIGVYE